ncbi:trigger factor [Drosophila bipectinata]|uniref:trigger factor n=1 Tax=Drosophila bipectinata TaxID=42026 RepID=UPI001C89EB81|nr:calsequestrin-1 [Drosophila bipectinata]
MKFRDTMKSFQVSPTAESLDEVMPVKNKDLDEMLELLVDDEDEDDEEEDDDFDEDDDDEDGGGDDDDDEQDDVEEVSNMPHILRNWLDRFKNSK